VAEKAREVARRMAGTDYAFTPAFEIEIQKSVDYYAQRTGSNAGDTPGKGDIRFVFERGQTVAPALSKAFRAHNISPLIGLYIPAVESEYVNIQTPNSMGAAGMFQFVPQTGEHYGLSAADLLDVDKSADAAARYIADSIDQFNSDRMKEALALLAYNRGGKAVESDIAALVNEQNRACSICALTEQRDKLCSSRECLLRTALVCRRDHRREPAGVWIANQALVVTVVVATVRVGPVSLWQRVGVRA